MKNKIFVYGTLLNAKVRKSVCGNSVTIKKKILKDFEKKGLNILEKKGVEVEGGLIEVDDEQLTSLNYYEGLGHLYKMIEVELEGEKAIAYQLI